MGMSQELATYRQMAVQTASPMELVIMLCDALVRDLNKVAAAIRVQDIEERVQQSNHALLVLQELDLMLDFENGGVTAKELARVYSYVRAKVIESQIKHDPAMLERQAEFILQIRQAWQQSAATVKQSAASSPASTIPVSSGSALNPYAGMAAEVEGCSWSA